MKTELLLALINEAFKDVKLEDGISISEARLMDDNVLEKQKYEDARKLDNEENWQDIANEKIENLADTPTFLDAKGLRFYLPAFMSYAVKNPNADSTAGYYAICQLNGDNFSRFHIFNELQKKAIREFLHFCIKNGDDLDSTAALEAIEWW